MKKPMEMEDARELLLEHMNQNVRTEFIPVYHAANRVVAKDYVAVMDQPPFSRSPLDGFALHHEDTISAKKEAPVQLPITMSVYAGDHADKSLPIGQAARIMTGAMIPQGADCIVRQEDTRVLMQKIQNKKISSRKVVLTRAMRVHDNICDQGEDIRAGTCIIAEGEILTPTHGAVLAGQGIFEVLVYSQVSVGILSTGSELADTTRKSGQIYDCNGPYIAMRLEKMGLQSVHKICKDEPQIIAETIRKMIMTQDAVITTGGVSVGEKDYLPEVCKRIGARILFQGLSMKPGSPMLAAIWQEKILFCLSGNPFAAATTLELMVLPALLKASNRKAVYPKVTMMTLRNDFPKASLTGRRFIRAIKEDEKVRIPENHSSGSIYSMVGCNCFIDIPAGSKSLTAGAQVRVVSYLEDSTACEKGKNTNLALPVVVCICGSKDTGKTTLIERLIPMLRKKGYRVGCLKHDAHDFEPDVEGTDSYRMEQAGAKAVAVYSNHRMLLYKETENLTYERILEHMKKLPGESLDIILVEGQKSSDLPKIEVLRRKPLTTIIPNLVSLGSAPKIVVSNCGIAHDDKERYPDCIVVTFDQLEAVTDWIVELVGIKR